jgi:CRP/FNR family transcriptional regulator, cyclic AMP receptor protein
MPGTTFDIEVIAAADLGVRGLGNGGVVYAKGDPGDCAYIVRSGKVEMRSAGCPIEVMKPGEIFGEMELLDNQPRSCWAVALSDAEIMPINRWLFEALIRDDPEFARTITQLVVRRLRAAFAQLDDPAHGPALQPTLGRRAPRISA